MKILIINTNSSAGGASKACFRLHESLLDAGMESHLLMLEQPPSYLSNTHNFYTYFQKQKQAQYAKQPFSKKVWSKIGYHLNVTEEAFYDRQSAFQQELISKKKESLEIFTFSISPYRIEEHPLYQEADVIHLHWVSNNYLDYSFFLKNQKPVVWTLHDMNPFTGGCHYAEDCLGFTDQCLVCPQLKGTGHDEYAGKMLTIKTNSMTEVKNITIVSPSKWLMQQSQKSQLFKGLPHFHIPYGIDSNQFQPREKVYSQQLLGIPSDRPVILFVAYSIASKRKGYHLLIEAINRLNLQDQVTLCAIGAKVNKTSETQFIELGSFSDERLMSIAYSAADVFVIPSLEDNLPNTVIESLLCGTPVIGFPVGGITDMIQDGENGFLCAAPTTDALVEQLIKFMKNQYVFDRQEIRKKAVQSYEAAVQAKRYIDLYQQLLSN